MSIDLDFNTSEFRRWTEEAGLISLSGSELSRSFRDLQAAGLTGLAASESLLEKISHIPFRADPSIRGIQTL